MDARLGAAGRTLEVLDMLQNKHGVTTAEAAEQLEIDNSNAYRLLKVIESCGYARKSGRRYYPGERLAEKICFSRSPFEVNSFAVAPLKELVRQTGISAHLCMLTADGAIFIGQEFTSDIIRIVKQTGTVEPFHCTASGKAMLAFLPESMRDKLISKITFDKYTDRTITDRELFGAQMNRITDIGYATDIGEYHPDVCCVCAPIFDENRLPRYAVGLSKPMTGGILPDFEKLGKLLMKTAAGISAHIAQTQ